jgi:hypothetical protein
MCPVRFGAAGTNMTKRISGKYFALYLGSKSHPYWVRYSWKHLFRGLPTPAMRAWIDAS